MESLVGGLEQIQAHIVNIISIKYFYTDRKEHKSAIDVQDCPCMSSKIEFICPVQPHPTAFPKILIRQNYASLNTNQQEVMTQQLQRLPREVY